VYQQRAEIIHGMYVLRGIVETFNYVATHLRRPVILAEIEHLRRELQILFRSCAQNQFLSGSIARPQAICTTTRKLGKTTWIRAMPLYGT
jgi:hypothetical protein